MGIIVFYLLLVTITQSQASKVTEDSKNHAAAQFYLAQILQDEVEYEGRKETVAYLVSRAAIRSDDAEPHAIQAQLNTVLDQKLRRIVQERGGAGTVSCATLEVSSSIRLISLSTGACPLGTQAAQIKLAHSLVVILEVRVRE